MDDAFILASAICSCVGAAAFWIVKWSKERVEKLERERRDVLHGVPWRVILGEPDPNLASTIDYEELRRRVEEYSNSTRRYLTLSGMLITAFSDGSQISARARGRYMSGAGLECCQVCGARIEPDRDYRDHTLMSSYEDCKVCDFYQFNYDTGNSQETIGFATIHYSYTDDEKLTPEQRIARQTERDTLLAEARRVVKEQPDYKTFLGGFPDNALVVADWLEDRGCEIMPRLLRSESSQ